MNTSSRTSMVGRAALARARALAAGAVALIALAELVLDPEALSWRYARDGFVWQSSVFLLSRIAIAFVTLVAVRTAFATVVGGGSRVGSGAKFSIGIAAVCFFATPSTNSCVTRMCPSWASASMGNWITFYAAIVASALLCRSAAVMLNDVDKKRS